MLGSTGTCRSDIVASLILHLAIFLKVPDTDNVTITVTVAATMTVALPDYKQKTQQWLQCQENHVEVKLGYRNVTGTLYVYAGEHKLEYTVLKKEGKL